jgi:hypothetical protein
MRVLLIAPVYDVPTTISNRAVFEFYGWLQQKKVPTEFLWGPLALRSIFENKVNSGFDLICYFGHGVEDALIGSELLSTLLDLKNAGKVQKPKIIYTMACLSGVKLGPEIAKNNVGYFGHATYYYAAFGEPGYDYYKDWAEYITLIPKLLLEGYSTTEAFEKYNEELTRLLEKYDKERIGSWDWTIETATKNRDYMRYFGPEITITVNGGI